MRIAGCLVGAAIAAPAVAQVYAGQSAGGTVVLSDFRSAEAPTVLIGAPGDDARAIAPPPAPAADIRTIVREIAASEQVSAQLLEAVIAVESDYNPRAVSRKGAQGLMQLMPATAKWVAKRIGLKDFSLARVTDMDTNVTLGTHYLSIVYSDLGNDPVLASAAYNAGPGRARKWRDSKPLEAAIYIEGIPFNETRDYVKKVMSNAVFYAAQFEGKPQSLKSRLGNVRPANGAETVPDTP